jgi:hypothetical protein
MYWSTKYTSSCSSHRKCPRYMHSQKRRRPLLHIPLVVQEDRKQPSAPPTHVRSSLRDLSEQPSTVRKASFCPRINSLVVPEDGVLLLRHLDLHAAKLRTRQHVAPNPSLPKRTCGISTLSPGWTLMTMRLPSRSRPPGPTARTLASLSSLTADSGRKMPPEVLASARTRWTRTRSRSGARDLMDLIARDWGVGISLRGR